MSAPSSKQNISKRKSSAQQGNERLKTVVRRLPPNLPEEVFWQSVTNWVTEDTVTWKIYYQGKLRKKLNKENIPSRAYIGFKNEELLAAFGREYDGHVFRDKQGNESFAVVEFAPYQKMPTEKKKVDNRNATIEKDEDYMSFLESLKAASANAEPVSLESLIAASQPPPPPKTTPLLEALKAEKTAQKDKEIILRSHAHYKEGSSVIAKKEDAKKKSTPAQKQPEAHPSSKKASKKAVAASAVQKNVTPQIATSPQAPKNAGSSNINSAKLMPLPAAAPTPPAAPAAKAPRSREHQARQQQAKTSAQPPTPRVNADNHSERTAGLAEAAASTAGASPANANTPRRNRPVVGIGRQFEAALSGAGVTVGSTDRRKRDQKKKDDVAEGNQGGTGEAKDVESGSRRTGPPAAGPPSSSGAAQNNQNSVQSILQRVVTPPPPPTQSLHILARPSDHDGQAPHIGNVSMNAETGAGRGGNPRRGRGGRGRGGHRGG